MKRREFVTLVGGAAAWPVAARGQQPKKPRIGVLVVANPEPFWGQFREALRELGYIEGQNIEIEFRSAEGKLNVLPDLAAKLVQLKVDVIVANQTPAARAAGVWLSLLTKRRPPWRRSKQRTIFRSSWRHRAIRSEQVSSSVSLDRAVTSRDYLGQPRKSQGKVSNSFERCCRPRAVSPSWQTPRTHSQNLSFNKSRLPRKS